MSTPLKPGAPTTLVRPGSQMWTIFRKEFREIFRDKRTLVSVVLGPLIITPGLFAIIGVAATKKQEAAASDTYHVGVISTRAVPQIEQSLQTSPGLKVEEITEKDAEAGIKSKRLSAAVAIPDDAAQRLAAQQAVPIQILQDAGSETSQAASRRLEGVFEHLGDHIVASRLSAGHLPPDFANPFKVQEKPIAEGGSIAMLILSQILPYILILSSFTGAIYAAFDQVAGEKERGTLETLLVSPASRRDIVLGKFGAVVGVCLVSSVLAIIGLIIPFVSGLKAFAFLSSGSFHPTPVMIGGILIVLLPLSVLFAGLLLAVSTFARNQKEAQTYLSSLFPIVLIPAMLSTVIGEGAGKAVALVPVLNASIIIKQAINGSYDIGFIVLAFLASAVYAGAALLFAMSLFQKESVLIKT